MLLTLDVGICGSEAARVPSSWRFFAFLIVVMLMVHWVGPTVAATPSDKRGITADDLLKVRDIKTMTVSPDGNYVAYQVMQANKETNQYAVDWYVVPIVENAKPIHVASGGEGKLGLFWLGIPYGGILASEIVWSVDSQWIYFTKTLDDAVQLWRSHRSDRLSQEQLTYNAADVERLKVSGDGRRVYFSVGLTRAYMAEANQREGRQGYLEKDLEIANYRVEYGPIWRACQDGAERWSFSAHRIDADEGKICMLTPRVFDVQTSKERAPVKNETEAYYSEDDTSRIAQIRRAGLKRGTKNMLVASADGQGLAWFENKNLGVTQPLMSIAASIGDTVFHCPAVACRSTRLENIWWRADGKEVFFQVRDGYNETLSSLYGWIPGEKGARAIISSDDMLYNCLKAKDKVICGHESWTSPRKIVAIELQDGQLITIVNINPEFKHFTFTKVEKILGEDAYGNKAHGHFVYPEDYQVGQRYPLVITQYGSEGFLRGGVGDEQPIHVLAQNGFAVLSFSIPKSDFVTKGSDIIAISIALQKYELIERGPVTAIERMLDHLDTRGLIDPSKVGITGLSTGAVMVDLALLSKNYAAASTAYSPNAPPGLRFTATSLAGKIRRGVNGGTAFSKTGFATWAKYSLGMNAHRINTPYLIQVADSEYYTTLQNYVALKDAGKPVEMHVFPNETHEKWQPAHRYAVYSRNIDWFNFWLRGVEDNSDDKVEQYERWRGLRTMHQANLQTLAAVH
ncbi:MAG: Atxe2 family lasso peptide isopeptidase [Kordiimonadaceae bacterium]|nr:Atxe2 family lasso peptide isopeptidase [Kordiimonadaceae bacterium]